jgi:nitrogen fixation/metabolism regulation signal transduction histidine kinase
VGIFLIVILTWIELHLLGLNSYLFFALFNVNLILLILVLFLVLRNVIKLILDRRRRVLGSGLRIQAGSYFRDPVHGADLHHVRALDLVCADFR